MKRLNFYPYYDEFLRSKTKTTTLRATNRENCRPGQTVTLTLGWDEQTAKELHTAVISHAYEKRISKLDASDFEGESPDCKSIDAARLVLSCIYKKVFTYSDTVWIVKFVHS